MQTLTNATILTVDEQDHFYPDGRIWIENGRIAAVGPAEMLPERGEVVDLGGGLVLPGLINTHTHSHSSLFRNQADDLALMDWLKKAMWPMEKFLSPERAYAATALSCLEYLRGGITTYADQFYYADTIAEAARRSGLRCFLAATVFTDPSPETADTFGAAEAFVERWKGREKETRVYPCIGPHAPYSVSGELFQKVTELSEKYDLLIHTHISETEDENAQLRTSTGLSPTQWLERLGVFERPVLAAHSIHLDDTDLDIYQKHGVHVTYNPVSNMKLASGVMPYRKMRERGSPISLGTDGAQSNNSMDLLRDLREGVLLQKVMERDATVISAREAVHMVTIEGARALRMERELGSLEPGKLADLIVLDPRSPRLTPLHRWDLEHLYGAVTYAACGPDVQDVMVGGDWLMRNRQVLAFDEDEVLREGQRASSYLVEHARGRG